MRKILLLLPLVAMCAFVSCDNEDEYDAVYVEMSSDVAPTYVPNADSTTQSRYMFLHAGASYRMTFNAREYKKGQLSRLTLKSFDRERSEVLVLDTLLSGRSSTIDYVYVAPDNLKADTVAITFIVTAYNSEGEACRREYKYTLVQEDYALQAIQGITMYANEGEQRPNGYSFTRQMPVRTSLSEPDDVDIYAYVDESNPENLAREWRTQSEVYFVKNNSFDYAKATLRSVSAAYSSAVPYHIVRDLCADDVIIVGKEKKPIGVIKIQAIYDEDGITQDRYYFDFKPIR